MHRMTGVVLSMGLVVLVVVLAAAAWHADSYEMVRVMLSHWLGQLFLIAWTASLYLNLWDAGLGFDLKRTEQTAYLTIAGTIVLTAATWLFACLL